MKTQMKECYEIWEVPADKIMKYNGHEYIIFESNNLFYVYVKIENRRFFFGSSFRFEPLVSSAYSIVDIPEEPMKFKNQETATKAAIGFIKTMEPIEGRFV